MSGYAHVKGERTSVIPALFNIRKVKAKGLDLFTGGVVLGIGGVLFSAALLMTDSYMKAYRNQLSVDIRRSVDGNRELGFRKKELETTYLKRVSPASLMERGRKRGLKVATKDKVISI